MSWSKVLPRLLQDFGVREQQLATATEQSNSFGLLKLLPPRDLLITLHSGTNDMDATAAAVLTDPASWAQQRESSIAA